MVQLPIIGVRYRAMILAFVAGWILGSVTLYSYLVITADDTPYPECMDCRKAECGNCPVLGMEDGRFRLAA